MSKPDEWTNCFYFLPGTLEPLAVMRDNAFIMLDAWGNLGPPPQPLPPETTQPVAQPAGCKFARPVFVGDLLTGEAREKNRSSLYFYDDDLQSSSLDSYGPRYDRLRDELFSSTRRLIRSWPVCTYGGTVELTTITTGGVVEASFVCDKCGGPTKKAGR